MELENFQLEIKDKVAYLAFNRPHKSNSLQHESWVELKKVFEYLSDLPEARVIVLSGNGKNFCAGIDLSMLMNINQHDHIKCEGRKREEMRKVVYWLQDCITAIEKCRKPVIAAIHRACIGGAVDIVSACDMRYCTDDAFFSIKEVDMGLVADIGTMQRLPKILNPGIMSELAYTGRNVGGQEAEKIGLCNRSYSDREAMMEGVNEIAYTIAAKSPLVIRGTKEMLLYTRDHTVDESLKYMGTYNAAYLMSDDLMESFKAQMAKTKPEYED